MGTTVDSAGAAAGERRGNTTHMLTKPTSDISERQKRSRQVPRKQDTLMRRLLEQDGISGQEKQGCWDATTQVTQWEGLHGQDEGPLESSIPRIPGYPGSRLTVKHLVVQCFHTGRRNCSNGERLTRYNTNATEPG